MADVLDQIRLAFDGDDTPKKNLALRKAHDEIELLRVALVRYGDRIRMSTVEPMAIQQVIDAAFQRTPSPQTNVRVKPLEWGDNVAHSPVGHYRVQRLDDKWEPLHNGQYMLPRVHGVVQAFDTLEAAKAAAHADYERRIRAALATTEGSEG